MSGTADAANTDMENDRPLPGSMERVAASHHVNLFSTQLRGPCRLGLLAGRMQGRISKSWKLEVEFSQVSHSVWLTPFVLKLPLAFVT
jgi:hypothetical protein